MREHESCAVKCKKLHSNTTAIRGLHTENGEVPRGNCWRGLPRCTSLRTGVACNFVHCNLVFFSEMEALLARVTEILSAGEFDALPDVLDQGELEVGRLDSYPWSSAMGGS